MHAIAGAEAVGPGRNLTGTMLVETPDGTFHRMTGRELVVFAERSPWIKEWRLDDEDTGRRPDDEGEDSKRDNVAPTQRRPLAGARRRERPQTNPDRRRLPRARGRRLGYRELS